jgi:hypothetical protein
VKENRKRVQLIGLSEGETGEEEEASVALRGRGRAGESGGRVEDILSCQNMSEREQTVWSAPASGRQTLP